ncbi:MAG: Ig-like domain-containing protein, partial [Clostridia bacterium]|nr:Ig-like domain-containing protein [Clostridia bacterium]
MKKKSIIALLLACSFAFGAAAFTGCNITDGDKDGQNQTDGGDKNDDKTPGTTTGDDKKDPVQTPGDNKEDENKNPVQKPDDNKEDENKNPDDTGDKKPSGDEEKDPPAPTTVKVTGLTLSPSTLTLDIGGTQTLVATVAPTDATNKKVNWSSDKTSIATVDSNGLVTAKAAGIANITAKTDDGNYSKTCVVTVKAAQTNPGTETEKPVVSEKITYSYAGNECAAFEWKDSNPANATVQYKLSTANSYTSVDSALVRASSTSGTARVDVVGLKGGEKYDFKITPSSGSAFTAEGVTVYSYDRSGYAHFGKSDGVGAYNNDGTPKSGAKIIYLTEENKNDIDGKGTSIAEYLSSFKDKTNTTPIIVRVVGTVGSATWNEKKYAGYSKDNPLTAEAFVSKTKGNGSLTLTTNSKADYTQKQLIDGGFNTLNTKPAAYNGKTCVAIDGLTSKIMCRQDSKTKIWAYDSMWNDCSIYNVKNVTIEGIGEDAEIFQWGFTFKNSSSIEVRNIHFDDYTEDACSFEGDESGATELSGFKSGNVWLHHNTFDEGKNYWDVCDEQDKGDGDGSTDFKGIKNITIAYNHYISTHKTNLIGGGDSHATANVTFHHNYYQSCNQRMPLGRQANMH